MLGFLETHHVSVRVVQDAGGFQTVAARPTRLLQTKNGNKSAPLLLLAICLNPRLSHNKQR